MSIQEKIDKASAWVNGYTVAGSALVIGVCHLPGAATATCMTIEGVMCYQIGRIFRGNNFSMHDATAAASCIGLASVAAKIVALEATVFLGPLGWPAKATISAAIIKILGEVIIKYFQSMEN